MAEGCPTVDIYLVEDSGARLPARLLLGSLRADCSGGAVLQRKGVLQVIPFTFAGFPRWCNPLEWAEKKTRMSRAQW